MMCLLKFLTYIDQPELRACVFRRVRRELFAPGGMVDESQKIYPLYGGVWYAQAAKWVFPSGAVIQFAVIPDDKALSTWLGSALTHILLDEAADGWTEKQFLFLLTRMRSATFKGKLQAVLAGNPNANSFLFNYVEPLLDPQTGVPREGVEKIIRWFVVHDDKVKWGDTPEELYQCYGQGKTLGKDFLPKSFRMIPLSVFQNTVLLKNNPEYIANLMTQPRANQLRFLHGSWSAVPDAGTYWKSTWAEENVINLADIPEDCIWARAYDFGSSAPSTALPNPDWSASALIGYSKRTGMYYVKEVWRDRLNMPDLIEEIIKTAFRDGIEDCKIYIPKDPGAAGTFASQFIVKQLAERGVPVKLIPTTGHRSKLSKFLPFCSVCEIGHVKWVRAPWNEVCFRELSIFQGGDRINKDDQVDAISDTFMQLARQHASSPNVSLSGISLTREGPVPS